MKMVSIASTGIGTRFTTETGAPVHGVRSARIEIQPDKITKASLSVYLAQVEVSQAMPLFFLVDPVTGEEKQVLRVEFVDGSSFDAVPRGL